MHCWIRSPLFDHGILTFPIRPTAEQKLKVNVSNTSGGGSSSLNSTSNSNSNIRYESECLHLSLFFSALKEFTDLSKIHDWEEATKKYLGWTANEANLSLDLFECLWKVELSHDIVDASINKENSKRLRFAQYLFVQVYELNRARRTSSLGSFNAHALPLVEEEEKEKERVDDLFHSVLTSRQTEWKNRLAFVQRHFASLLELLVSLHGAGAEGELTIPVIDSLGFMIAASDGKGDRARRLSGAFPMEIITAKDVKSFASFVVQNLSVDEARTSQWWVFSPNDSTMLPSREQHFKEREKNKPVIVCGAMPHEVVIIPPTTSAPKTSMFIAACKGAVIFAGLSSTFVHIIGCSDCTVFLGPISGVLTMEHCERMQIHSACNFLKLINCVDDKVNVWCGNIQLGPFCLKYPNVVRDLLSIFSTLLESDLFSAPLILDLGGLDDSQSEQDQRVVYHLQSEEDFCYEPVINFDSSLAASSINDALPPIPAKYAKRLQEKAEALKERKAKLNLLSVEDADFVKGSLLNSFQEYLSANGHSDYLANFSNFKTKKP